MFPRETTMTRLSKKKSLTTTAKRGMQGKPKQKKSISMQLKYENKGLTSYGDEGFV